ncbi:MAG TPA: hypothetical protein P5024_10715 [Burkholderiaceae bacterium]|nr:hypothetical protein [Burkholderiaceae bacterium]HRZ02018.1 hypothetical protein [Burkholderiaceae bacterium]
MLAALQAWPPLAALRASAWGYPVLEIVHIAGFALLVGSLAVLDARVWGAARGLPLVTLGRLAVRMALLGLAVAATAGLVLFATGAAEFAANPAFRLKLVLIAMALANAVLFHVRGSLQRADGVARAQALASALLWIGVIAAGRLIAYV